MNTYQLNKMKRYYIFLFMSVVALLTACGPDREKLLSEITQSEQSLTTLQYELDTVAAQQLLKDYARFADHFPDDTLAPVFLLKSASLLLGIGDPDQAVGVFDRLIEQYPQYEDLPLCYIFKGKALEESQRTEEAVEVYETFLQNYPDHFLAHDISTVLPLVRQGMNEEQQLEYLIAHAADSTQE